MNQLREFICYNQKQIIRFEYEISQYHKAFRKSIDDNRKQPTINKYYKVLIFNSFDMLNKIYAHNSKMIEKMFHSNIKITMKMVNDTDDIVDIYRNDNFSIFNTLPIKNNSGFNAIMNNRKPYYLCDDLENEFKNNSYINDRIDSTLLEKLKQGKVKWKDCWLDFKKKSDTKSYYNSTMIIPMSITDQDEDNSSKFYQDYFIENSNANKKTTHKNHNNDEVTRAIFGFLCIDTKEKDFFTNIGQQKSIDYGFIISDMLSIYLTFFHNYTTNSKTVQQYIEKL